MREGAIELIPATPADALTIRGLAESIWWEVYPAFLSADQIAFMLNWMYAPAQLRAELSGGETVYQLFRHEEKIVGYAAQQDGDAPGEVHLSKFYLLTGLHGRGLGSAALQVLASQAKTSGAASLTLRVNRHNQPALRCYMRNGFRVVRDVTSHIGSGFVMDDHWMQLDLR
jgi:ribosomal protein S18 acetylase RimI-like enzyme